MAFAHFECSFNLLQRMLQFHLRVVFRSRIDKILDANSKANNQQIDRAGIMFRLNIASRVCAHSRDGIGILIFKEIVCAERNRLYRLSFAMAILHEIK